MTVRIRLQIGPKISKAKGKNRNVALAIAALVTPGTLLAFVFAVWRMSADLGFTAQFPITEGLLSHWQVWLAIAVVSQFFTSMLNRYGREGSFRSSIAPAAEAAVRPTQLDSIVATHSPAALSKRAGR